MKRFPFGLLVAAVLVGLASARSARAQEAPPPPPPPPEIETPAGTPPAPGTPPPAPPETSPAPAPAGGGRALLLPDISLIANFLGHVSTDKRDPNRDRLKLDEAELAIQSYVYPSVQAQAFFVFPGDGGAVVEEAYLNFQNLQIIGQGRLPLSAVVGRRKVPFGRVNQLHPHSWLYTVQPYVLSNLVAGESLNGDGAYLSYLLPTGKLFTQFDAGFWSLSESPEDFEAQNDPSEAIITSPGAGFADKFTTLRLWTAADTLGGSLELGGSYARGRGLEYAPAGGAGEGGTVRPTIQLSGLDLTYRRQGHAASRLLLRGEYLWHRQTDGNFKRTASGYYLFADQRLNPQAEIGLRYDRSEFPFAPGFHESAVSLIGTYQFTEQFYTRMQLIQGERPGKSSFTEVWLQLVWGVGPHTHNLE